MKITHIRSMLLKGPRPHGVGAEVTTARKLIVRVDTDAGVYGLGECEYFMGVREGIQYCRDCLLGRDPLKVRPLVSELIYGSPPPFVHSYEQEFESPFGPCELCSPTATPTGPIIWALSGVEMALVDLIGKAHNLPAHALLGGAFRDRVRVYLDRSAPKDKENLDAWKRMATEVVESGFTQMKFDIDCMAPKHVQDAWNRCISPAQMRRTVERVKAAREAAGWDVDIAVDCHMQYNVPDATVLAQELAPVKLTWLEDPTPITNPDAVAQVRNKSPVSICVGEMFTPEQFRLFIAREACDILHPDILFIGGMHEMRKVADYAEMNYLPMAMHNNGGALAVIAAAHVAAAIRNFLSLEFHFIEAKWMCEYVRRDGEPLFKDGHIELTDAPGLGVEIDEKVCREQLAPGEVLF